METTATLPSDRLSRGRLSNVPRRVPSPVTNGTPMGEPIWTWGVKAQAHVVALATDPGLCRRLRRLRLRSRPSSAPWFWPVPHQRTTCGRRRKCAWLPFLRPAQSRRRRRASPREVGGGNGADLKQLCFDLRRHREEGIRRTNKPWCGNRRSEWPGKGCIPKGEEGRHPPGRCLWMRGGRRARE